MTQVTADRAALNDVEEISDRFLHRPVAVPLVRLLLPTPVSPDQITLMSGVAGVAAGVTLALGVDRPLLRLASAALLFGSTVLDCVDGQLARARKTMSSGGMALDTAADVVVGFSMVVAATYFASRYQGSSLPWLLTPLVLASYGMHCLLFDIVKERYLADHRIAYASSKAVQAEAPPRQAGAMHWIFDLYWRVAGPIIRAQRRQMMSLGTLRAWTLLGPGTHMTFLYAATAIAYLWPPAVYFCLLLFGTGMNALLAALLANNASPVRA
jgi:phosphatidylglycerophosphate synthase